MKKYGQISIPGLLLCLKNWTVLREFLESMIFWFICVNKNTYVRVSNCTQKYVFNAFVFGFHIEECHIIKYSGFLSNCFHVLCVHTAVEAVSDNADAKPL